MEAAFVPKNDHLFEIMSGLLARSLDRLTGLQEKPVLIPTLWPMDFKRTGEDIFGMKAEIQWVPPADLKEVVASSGLESAIEEISSDEVLRPRLTYIALSGAGGGQRNLGQIFRLRFLDEYVRSSQTFEFNCRLPA